MRGRTDILDHALAAARRHGRPVVGSTAARTRRPAPARGDAPPLERPARRRRARAGAARPTRSRDDGAAGRGRGRRASSTSPASASRSTTAPRATATARRRRDRGSPAPTCAAQPRRGQGPAAGELARRYDPELGRARHLAAVRPAAAGAGRGPRRAGAPARPRARRASRSCSATSRAPARCSAATARPQGLRRASASSTAALAGLRAASRAARCPPARSTARAARAAADRAARPSTARRPERARRSRRAAGEAVAELQRRSSAAPRLRRRPSASSTPPRRKAELVARRRCPSCARGRARSLRRLRAHAAGGAGTLVPAHGDFHVDQLLVGDGRPRGRRLRRDVPRRAGARPRHLRGRRRARPRRATSRRSSAVLEALLDGYGARPETSSGTSRRRSSPAPRTRSSARSATGPSASTRWSRVAEAALLARARHRLRRLHRLAPDRALLADGHEVVGVDCFTDNYGAPTSGQPRARARRTTRFELLTADLAERGRSARCSTACDVVFHLAAQPGVRRAGASASTATSTTTSSATQRLLEAARRRRARASSTRRRRRSTATPSALPTREDAPPRPLSPYGVTKLAAEHLCRALPRQPRRRRGRAALLHRLRPAPAPRHGLPPLLRGRARAASRSRCSATAARRATSPTSTTSSRRCAPPRRARRRRRPRVYNVGGGVAGQPQRARSSELAAIAGRPLDVRRGEPRVAATCCTPAPTSRAPAQRARLRARRRRSRRACGPSSSGCSRGASRPAGAALGSRVGRRRGR